MVILRSIIFAVFISESNTLYVKKETNKNVCLMQLITRYMNHKRIYLYRDDEKVDFDFPFDKNIPFVHNTKSRGSYIEFGDTRMETSHTIIYIPSVKIAEDSKVSVYA